jgi:hypothetical protein
LARWLACGIADGRVEQERLPFEEGFKRSDKMLSTADILALEEKVNAASKEQMDEIPWQGAQ